MVLGLWKGLEGPELDIKPLWVPLQKTLYGANVIIFEGIMAFADKTLLEVRACWDCPLCKHPCPSPTASMLPAA